MHWTRIALLGAVAAIATACQAPVVPLSAQQGSSVLIPIGGYNEVLEGWIGYGGSLKADPQRGTLVYRLDGPSGTILPTYTTSLIPVAPSSPIGRDGSDNTAPWMIASLVDVPLTAPLGTHALYVTHEVAGQVEQVPYAGTLRILPNQIEVSLPGGGTETITGAVTRINGALTPGGAFGPFGNSGRLVIPDPQLMVSTGGAHALELEVDFPTAIMDARDAFEQATIGYGVTHPATVFFSTDEASGVVRIRAVSASDRPIAPIAIAFTLAGSTRLDPAQVDVDVTLATDENGDPFSYQPSAWIQ